MISYKKPTYNDADGVKLVAIHHYYTISFWFYVLIYRYVYHNYQCICLGNWRSFSASPSFPVATSMRIFSSVFFFVSLLFLIKLETYRPCGSIQILIVKTHIKITHLIFKNCWIVTWFYVLTQQTFERRFNVVFRLIWRRDVAIRQINVEYGNVEIYNLDQRRIKVAYSKVDLKNVRQRRNNIVIFNVDFHNVGQRRNNVVNMTIWKKNIKPPVKNKIIFLSFKQYAGLKISVILCPILREICKRIFAEPWKFLKHRIYWITKTIFKPSHFVKCQLVFNFTRGQVQAHHDYHSFNLSVSFKHVMRSSK